MGVLNRLPTGVKRGLCTALAPLIIYSGSHSNKPEAQYQHTAHRVDAVNVAKDYGTKYPLTYGDLAVDLAIINRETVDKGSSAWDTLRNPAFEQYINLPWDNGERGFSDWVKYGIQPSITFVNPTPSLGVAIKSHETLVDPVLSKYITEITQAVTDSRNFGRDYYKAVNVKYIVEKFLESLDYEQLDAFLRKGGLSPQKIDEYAGGLLHPNAVAGISYIRQDGKSPIIRFSLAQDIAQKLGREAIFYDIDVLNALKNTLRHEIVHLYRITDEEQLENLLIDFYEGLIRQLPDSNSTYATRRHAVEKCKRANLEQEIRISRHRAPLVAQIYGKLGSKENISIDELVTILEKQGLSEKEITEVISTYESKISKSTSRYSKSNENKYVEDSEEYNSESAYKESADSTSEGNANNDSAPQDSGGEGSGAE